MIISTPEDFTQGQRLVEAKVGDYLRIAEKHYGKGFPMPKIRYCLKGRTGGTASAQEKLIKLNPVLMRENFDHYLIQTVGHEVAHLVQRWVFGYDNDPHGNEWRQVMSVFRLPPNRCHSYDTSNVPTVRAKTNRPSVRIVNNNRVVTLSRGGLNMQITTFD